jgi:hypothetical protein
LTHILSVRYRDGFRLPAVEWRKTGLAFCNCWWFRGRSNFENLNDEATAAIGDDWRPFPINNATPAELPSSIPDTTRAFPTLNHGL